MELLKRVIKKSLIIILPVAAASAFFEWKKLPLGIVMGGLFGIFILRGTIKSAEGLVKAESTMVRTAFGSLTRVMILFAAIFVLIWAKIINVIGMLFGFTLVFFLILSEGKKSAKKD